MGCRDAGLNVFHIEVTRDKSSTFVYACSSSLWHPNRVVELFEKYYDPQYDYLKFYNQRSCGLDPEGLRFKRNQKSSLRFDIIYYTSTPYEFIGFGLDATSYLNITKRIFDELIYFSSQGYRVAIREHPNFITSSQLDQDYYSDLCNKARDAGVIVFDSLSEIDSYSLFDNHSIVISAGSTIGGELAYLGNPVLEFNPLSLSLSLGLTKFYSRDLLISYLVNRNSFQHSPRLSFKKFAFINSCFGHKIPYASCFPSQISTRTYPNSSLPFQIYL